jgi:hypothetical protein
LGLADTVLQRSLISTGYGVFLCRFLIIMVPDGSGGIVPCTGMKSPEGGFGDASFRCSFVLTRGYFA